MIVIEGKIRNVEVLPREIFGERTRVLADVTSARDETPGVSRGIEGVFGAAGFSFDVPRVIQDGAEGKGFRYEVSTRGRNGDREIKSTLYIEAQPVYFWAG
jgi:hypothetical protein